MTSSIQFLTTVILYFTIRLKQNLYAINQSYIKYLIFSHSDLSKGKEKDKTETKSLSNKSKLRNVFNFQPQ